MRFEEQNNETKITTMLDKIYKKLAGDDAEVDTDLATYPNDVKVPLLLEKIYEVIDNSGEGGGADISKLIPTVELPTEAGASVPAATMDAIFIPNDGNDGVSKFWPPFIRLKFERPISHGRFDSVLALTEDGFQHMYTNYGTNSTGDYPFRFLYYKSQGMGIQTGDTSVSTPDSNFSYNYNAASDSYVLTASNS